MITLNEKRNIILFSIKTFLQMRDFDKFFFYSYLVFVKQKNICKSIFYFIRCNNKDPLTVCILQILPLQLGFSETSTKLNLFSRCLTVASIYSNVKWQRVIFSSRKCEADSSHTCDPDS